MQNLISISIPVGDRSYRLKIKAEDEETVRKMAGDMNDQLNQLKSQYPGKDMQDYLAMTLLSFVTEEHSSNAQVVADLNTKTFLSRIEEFIENGLMD